MDKYEIRMEGEVAKVYTPYNKEFIARLKLLGGKWSSAESCWKVPAFALEDTRKAMRDIYGRDDTETKTVDITIRTTEDISEHCAPVVMYGRTVASAFGRDSGAKSGNGVIFRSGSPKSGGSVKNWYTLIPEGCEIVLHAIPANMAENTPEGVEVISITENATIDRAALEAERERLKKRLAEIDALLDN